MGKIINSQNVIWSGTWANGKASNVLYLRFDPTHVYISSASGYNTVLDASIYVVGADWVEGNQLAVINQPVIFDSTAQLGVMNSAMPSRGGKFLVNGIVRNSRIEISKKSTTEAIAAGGYFALTLQFTQEEP